VILVTYRSVEIFAGDRPLRTMKEELELHRYCKESRLKLLKETDIADYLALRFSGNRSRQFDRFTPAIHSRTDGDPLFTVNVFDYLIARWIKSHGRAAEARTILAEIYNRFTEGFNTIVLKEGKALLDELAEV
jgi:hypothetical protein